MKYFLLLALLCACTPSDSDVAKYLEHKKDYETACTRVEIWCKVRADAVFDGERSRCIISTRVANILMPMVTLNSIQELSHVAEVCAAAHKGG